MTNFEDSAEKERILFKGLSAVWGVSTITSVLNVLLIFLAPQKLKSWILGAEAINLAGTLYFDRKLKNELKELQDTGATEYTNSQSSSHNNVNRSFTEEIDQERHQPPNQKQR